MEESTINFIANVLATSTGFFIVEFLFTYRERKKMNEIIKNAKELMKETREEREIITKAVERWNELVRMEDENK